MIMNYVGLFVLGLLIGVGLAWYLQEKYRAEDARARDALHEARLKQMQDEVLQADSAHAETKERLIALQLAHTELERRAEALEAELARLRRGDGAEPAQAAASVPLPAPLSTGDDLTRIKGIGKIMEKKLHDLGIYSFQQLASLSPEEARRINAAIDFPGRVERERWIEQARSLTAS